MKLKYIIEVIVDKENLKPNTTLYSDSKSFIDELLNNTTLSNTKIVYIEEV